MPSSAAVLLLLALLSSCGGDAGPAAERALPGDAASKVAAVRDEAAPAPLEIPADAPRVVFLGDSLAAGLHLPADQAFPAALQRQLAAQGLPFHLVNAGVSGDTSAGGLRRVDWVLQQKPDVLVVELGGNDGLRGQDPAGVEQNLRGIVQKARAAGARVVLVGVQVPTSLGAEYGARFAAIYPRVASERDVTYVPGFLDGVGGVPEMLLEDGLHPNVDGHDRLARNLAPALRGVLEALRAPAAR